MGLAAPLGPAAHARRRCPHLPSTWQELLDAYLQVVGVRSEDCYGVQVTRTAERAIADLSMASFAQELPPRRRSRAPTAGARACTSPSTS